jgi:ferredoxin
MEGDGPAGGNPRQVGALLASPDPVALDVVAASMAGLDPMEVYTIRAAARRNLGPSSIDDVTVAGPDWRELAPAAFVLPVRDLGSRVPQWLSKRARHWTTSRPYLERAASCTACGTCEESCPVGAITRPDGSPVFDYHTCIRCYCCQELCPPQVIGLKMPTAARMMTRRSRQSMERTAGT